MASEESASNAILSAPSAHSSTDPIPPSASPAEDTVTAPSTNEGALSAAAAALCSKHIPRNTTRSNTTSLRALCTFVAQRQRFFRPEYLAILADVNDRSPRRVSLLDQAVRLTRLYLFQAEENTWLPPKCSAWTQDQLKRINDTLIEFVAHYRKVEDGSDIKPTTLRSYIMGLQRAFNSEWEYKLELLRGDVFSDEKSGLVTVVDNKIKEQQALGVSSASHNVLSKIDLVKLYESSALSKATPRGFIARMIFNIALMTGFRPSELRELKMADVSKIPFEEEYVWRIVGKIGSVDRSSKTQGGGLRYVNSKPKEVLVHDCSQLGGLVNVFEDMEEYWRLVKPFRENDEEGRMGYFLAVNYAATYPEKFFKNSNLGRHSIGKYVKDACDSVVVSGTGVRKSMTTHGLRGTVITQLFEAGHADSSVSVRTGHKQMRSLQAYQNMRGVLGKRQQIDIPGGENYERPEKVQRARLRTDGSAKVGADSDPCDTENRDPNKVGGRINDAGGRGSLQSGLVTSIHSVTGNVTVSVNYYGDKLH